MKEAITNGQFFHIFINLRFLIYNEHSFWLELLQKDEIKNYTNCIRIFLTSNDRVIQEGSIATCQLIITKVIKRQKFFKKEVHFTKEIYYNAFDVIMRLYNNTFEELEVDNTPLNYCVS
ncbi:hypothetical protein LIT38_15715 [Bacillus sp. CMF12]|uniref:hypothetical protein n=1 Tax=Bacillus sp. CMF12 TaxID=2884834 RepID=UPI00207A6550|nr:hypothetical protein [Bacillus sp. CMF12]USK48019.1 hypothetical protein LIT38_15715 [Bacillus sp. CMF12]